VVASRERSEDVDRRRREFRAALEIETITVREGMDAAFRIRAELDRNRIVALLVDRHLGKDRLEVRFFGRRAFFLRTPALLAFFTGAPLIPSFVYRGDDGRFNIDCGPAIHVSRAGNRDDNIRAATQQVADEIERYIRRYPHYWYQFYRFWQSQTD
jgi:lauroyl/myristoyl acyltransferase